MFFLLFFWGMNVVNFRRGKLRQSGLLHFFVYSESCIQYNLKKMYANIK